MLDVTQIFDGIPPASVTASPTGVAVTTTRVSTNTLNLLAARDMGGGNPLGIHVLVTTTFSGGTSLAVSLETSATEGGTYVSLISSPTILTANLVAGVSGSEIFRYVWPPNESNNASSGILAAPGQYARLRYTVVGTYTAGAVFAYVTPSLDRNVFRAGPVNYTVAVASGELA